MNRITITAALILSLGTLSTSAFAADYRCQGERVEKSGSTKYTVRTSGSDITIEKSGSTVGRAIQRGSKYYVEVSGSTVATIENGKIEKSGSSWGTVSEAQRTYECSELVAATLWVLEKAGKL